MSLTTFEQQGDIIDHIAGTDLSAGDIIVAGSLVGQVVASVASGARVGLRVEGVIRAPKLSTDVVVVGAPLYWDDAESRLTVTAGSLKQAGWAVEAAGSGVSIVAVKLGR
ncbi:MAG: DUF2190 family protein [Pirellulaceae bacterium]|nr:DUF2190 family protein [Pirellulaceae bacterium]